jgi:hypothetical protein
MFTCTGVRSLAAYTTACKHTIQKLRARKTNSLPKDETKRFETRRKRQDLKKIELKY